MLEKIESNNHNAPVVVLFGGNPLRRDEVLRLLRQAVDITAYGTLSEEEGMQLLRTLPRIDLVLIGGRYSEEQRLRISTYVQRHLPNTPITQPGWDYPYDNIEIEKDVLQKLKLGPK